MFYSVQGYNGPLPSVGDIVNVRLRPGDTKFNLQHGIFLNLESDRRRQVAAGLSTQCDSLKAAFEGASEIGALGDNALQPAAIQFETDLEAAFTAAGLPFTVTDRARSVDIQVQRIKSMYRHSGGAEVISNYRTSGPAMVRAIETGNDGALFEAARGSSSHLRGMAIDIRSKEYDVEPGTTGTQINRALAIIRGLGGIINLEPSSTDCWSVKGTAVRPAGTTTHRKVTTPPGGSGDPCRGACCNEHIHITIPEGYDGQAYAALLARTEEIREERTAHRAANRDPNRNPHTGYR